MRMNKKLLLTASVFFVILGLVECGIATIFYVDTTISKFTTDNDFTISFSDPHNNLNWIYFENGPALLLAYIVTDQQGISDSILTSEFNKQFVKKPFGNHIHSDFSNRPILETESLKLFAFSGNTIISIPNYHATAKTPTNSNETFNIMINPIPGTDDFNFILTSKNNLYDIHSPVLLRYTGEPFDFEGKGNSDYLIPVEDSSSRFCHFFAAINAGEGSFNNIYWSDLKYLGNIELIRSL